MFGSVSVDPSQLGKQDNKSEKVSARDVKPHKAQAWKSKTTKAQQKKSPSKSSKKLPNTAVKDAVSEQQDGEDRIQPQERYNDQMPSNKKNGNTEYRPENKKQNEIMTTKYRQIRTKKKTASRQIKKKSRTKSRQTTVIGVANEEHRKKRTQ